MYSATLYLMHTYNILDTLFHIFLKDVTYNGRNVIFPPYRWKFFSGLRCILKFCLNPQMLNKKVLTLKKYKKRLVQSNSKHFTKLLLTVKDIIQNTYPRTDFIIHNNLNGFTKKWRKSRFYR